MKIIAWDTETYLIEPGNLTPRLVCLTHFDGEEEGILAHSDGVAWFWEHICDPEVILVGHNVSYDLGVMVAADPGLLPFVFLALEQGRVRDTMIRDKLLLLAQGRLSFDFKDNNRKTSFSLTSVVRRRFSIDISESKKGENVWRLRYSELDGIPIEQWPQDAIVYALDDACWTWRCHQRQAEPFICGGVPYGGPGGIVNEDEQLRAAWSLHLMSVWGIRTDPEAVDALEAELKPRVQAIHEKLLQAGLMRYKKVKGVQKLSKNMSALRERVEAAYAKMGLKPLMTEKGAISTARVALAASGDSLLEELGSETGAEKLLTAFVPVLRAGTQTPLNPGYDVMKESGRTSSFNPNIQQTPRMGGVRECYVPRAGNSFVTADYSTLELCTLAQVCLDLFGYSLMAEAINAGRDLHLDMASAILGISYEEILSRHEMGDAEVKETRQMSKAAGFGYPGGLGTSSFVRYAKGNYGVEISEADAAALKEQWFGKWPEMRDFFKYVGGLSPFGNDFSVTQHRSLRQRGGCNYNAGCNTFFQGLAADGAKEALWRVAQECYADSSSPLFGARPVAFLHDEIMLECPEGRITEVALRLKQVMEEGMDSFVPDVKITAEPAAMLRWYKSASPVWKDGELLPWTP